MINIIFKNILPKVIALFIGFLSMKFFMKNTIILKTKLIDSNPILIDGIVFDIISLYLSL